MQEEKFNKQDGNLDQPNVTKSLFLAGCFEKAEQIFQQEIQKLELEKHLYGTDEDMYSWHLVDDEQKVWKKALAIIRTGEMPIEKVESLDNGTLPF